MLFYCVPYRVEPSFPLLARAVESVEVNLAPHPGHFSHMAMLPQTPRTARERRVGKGADPQVGVAAVEAVVGVAHEASVAVLVGVYHHRAALNIDYGQHRGYALVDDFRRIPRRIAPLLDVDGRRQLQFAVFDSVEEIDCLPLAVAVEAEEMISPHGKTGTASGKIIAHKSRVAVRHSLARLEIDKINTRGCDRVEVGAAVMRRQVETADRVAPAVELNMWLPRLHHTPQRHPHGKNSRESNNPDSYRPGTLVAQSLHTTKILTIPKTRKKITKPIPC